MVRMRSASAIRSRRFRFLARGDLALKSGFGGMFSGMAFPSDKWCSNFVYLTVAAPERECEVNGIGFTSTATIDDRLGRHLAMAAGGGEG